MFIRKKLSLGLLISIATTTMVLASGIDTQTPHGTPDAIKPLLGNDSSQTSGTNTKANVDNLSGNEATPTSSNGSQGGLSDAQFEKKVIEILNKNPQAIIQALQGFQQQQIKAQEEKIKASLMKYKNEIAKDSNAIVLGKKDAEVKLVVFLDPNCPHCRPFSLALNKARENYPNLAILIRHWPILGKDSEDVVRGLWAIKQQGEDKFNAATKAIATSEEKFTFAKLLSWVQDHNLNVKKFQEDADAKATKDVIEETRKLANDIGFEGTPTSLLIDKGGIRLVVPTDEKSLDNILKNAGKETPAQA